MPNPSNKPLSKLDRVVANAQRLADKGRVHPDVPDFYRESGGRGQTAPSSRIKKRTKSPVNFNAAVTGDPKNARKILEDALRKIMSPEARAAFLKKYQQAIDDHLPF